MKCEIMMKKSIIIGGILIVAIVIVGIILGLFFLLPKGGDDNGQPIYYSGNFFISKWNTSATESGSSNSNQVSLPLVSGGTYCFNVDWGDGTTDLITNYSQSEKVHTYSSEGVYTIRINGSINGWNFAYGTDELKIMEIQKWGDLRLGNLGNYFAGCANLEITADDTLNLNGTTDLNRMFMSCVNLVGHESMNNWDVSKITDMYGVFWHAHKFNSSIGDWDVSKVEKMRNLFCRAESFNQDISGWDVSNVKEMNSMFGAAHSFNQDISGWDVSNVEDMQGMFNYAYSFNQDIGDWNVSNVKVMTSMFNGARIFDQNISDWDVSNVESMERMFINAYLFNQDIGNWDVSNVTTMKMMFYNSTSFDQDIGNWDVSNVTTMVDMFQYIQLSTVNYDSLLIGWNNLTTLQNGVSFNGGLSTYTAGGDAEYAHDVILEGKYEWVITDGGSV
ncbi:MAG: BspA family leucine-rich repeat surface protein [Promethearchaeota archaeon]|nr:MAG: BspA family leucine-rich repeat surface protein [Candidatus Lokiarchaeota archaeon]